MDLGLADRVFIIGGGSAGLGFATASVLVEEGARVIIIGRNEERVDAAVTKLGVGSAAGCAGDLAHPAVTAAAIETAVSCFGRLDGALANTGGPPRGMLTTTTDAAWRQAFDSAFLAPVRLAREVGLHTRQDHVEGAAICFVLSISVRNPLPQLTISNGLRPGLAMLVKDLADELGPPPNSVRVTGVLPGSFATARSLSINTQEQKEQQRAWIAAIPLRRTGDPLELGRVAAFLLSPAAAYVTGTVVAVDGGACRAI
ncbi:MAG: SDR family oxidoreductase [Actinomycetota bacterium]|nr:SDR family oxidoreductase [Actinomycetota bacterium]